MAKNHPTSAFIKSDFQKVFEIRDDAETACINISGWTLSWMVKRYKDQADAAAILTKTTTGGAIVISGSFNADPDVNTQVATLTIADTDTTSVAPRMYWHELKRMDAGFEVPLVVGAFDFQDGVHD
jgi:hypothetical protein